MRTVLLSGSYGVSSFITGVLMMGVLADWQIKEQVQIKPWDDGGAKPGVISYGCTSYGYDIRLGWNFAECRTFGMWRRRWLKLSRWLRRMTVGIEEWEYQLGLNTMPLIDPKYFHKALFKSTIPNSYYVIPPHGFVLAESYERVKIPRDVVGICVGKSTYARCGLVVNVTPLEPEWEGIITLELSNTTPLPIVVYCGEGIAQVVFHKADSTACLRSYADKKGRYQGQTGLTLPFVEGV